MIHATCPAVLSLFLPPPAEAWFQPLWLLQIPPFPQGMEEGGERRVEEGGDAVSSLSSPPYYCDDMTQWVFAAAHGTGPDRSHEQPFRLQLPARRERALRDRPARPLIR